MGVAAGELRVAELLLLGDGELVSFLESAVLGHLTFVESSFLPEFPSGSSTPTSAITSSFPPVDCAAAAESRVDSDGSRPAPGSLSRSPDIQDCISRGDSLAMAYVLGSGNPSGFQPSSLNDQSEGLRVRNFGGYEGVVCWE